MVGQHPRLLPTIWIETIDTHMKVTGTGTTSSLGGTRRTGRTDRRGGEFARHLDGVDGSTEPMPVDHLAGVSAMDALFAAQSVTDSTDQEGRKRMVRRGEDILDSLDTLRVALLTGTIPPNRLAEQASRVRSQRDSVVDPQLAALLDEIELRAEVELAKLSRD